MFQMPQTLYNCFLNIQLGSKIRLGRLRFTTRRQDEILQYSKADLLNKN